MNQSLLLLDLWDVFVHHLHSVDAHRAHRVHPDQGEDLEAVEALFLGVERGQDAVDEARRPDAVRVQGPDLSKNRERRRLGASCKMEMETLLFTSFESLIAQPSCEIKSLHCRYPHVVR